jgi:hypothetical protein
MPLGADAVIGGNIASWRAIGGKWRAATDDDEHYVYAVALRSCAVPRAILARG